MATVEEILKQTGLTDEQIKALDPKVTSGFTQVLSSATQTLEEAERAKRATAETFDKEMNTSNVKKFLKDSSLVVDCFDNTSARQIVQDHCRSQKLPCLHTGMFEGYGEIVHDQEYMVPVKASDAVDVCEAPLTRTLIMMVVTIASEEIMDMLLQKKPRMRSWAFTLKDLRIGAYK